MLPEFNEILVRKEFNVTNYTNKLDWYIFYTYPRAEKIVNNELLKIGYETYLPLQKVDKIWKNRQKKQIDVPIFPNYIFVRTHQAQLYNISNLPKIVTYVSIGNKPSKISEKEIEAIRIALSLNKEITIEREFYEGEKVRITQGPLAGYEGILMKQKNKARFGIQLKEINQAVFIDICIDLLERL